MIYLILFLTFSRSPFFPSFVGYEQVGDGVTVSAVEPPTSIATPTAAGVLMQPLPKVNIRNITSIIFLFGLCLVS